VLITDTQEPILVLRVYHAGGGEDLAIASLPLGVFLPAGIGLVIDAQPEQRFVYVTCNQSGCHVGIPLDSALLAGLKVGATALVRVFDGGQQPVDLPLSLSGFAQGHAALVGRAPQAMRFGDQTPGAAAPKAGDLSLWPHT
jgi:invasion protein IalB